MSFGNAVVFLIVFCFSCIFAHILASADGALRIGRTVSVKSRLLRFLVLFPVSLFVLSKGELKKYKNYEINIFGMIFCFLNHAVLLGGILLQFLPVLPCEAVGISFGIRHRGFAFTADTYNEKVPLLSIWILLFLQLLIVIVRVVVADLVKKDSAKKLSAGSLILLFTVMLLTTAALVYFAWLLFK